MLGPCPLAGLRTTLAPRAAGQSSAPVAFAVFWNDSALWAVGDEDGPYAGWSASVGFSEAAGATGSLPQGPAAVDLLPQLFHSARWKRCSRNGAPDGAVAATSAAGTLHPGPAGSRLSEDFHHGAGDDRRPHALHPPQKSAPFGIPGPYEHGDEEEWPGAREERRAAADGAARAQSLPPDMSEPAFLRAVVPGSGRRFNAFASTVRGDGHSPVLVHAFTRAGWAALHLRMVNTASGRIHECDVSASEVWAAARRQRAAGPALWHHLCAEAWMACEGRALQQRELRARGRAQGLAVAQSLSRAQLHRDAERRDRQDLQLMRSISAQAARESARHSDDATLNALLVTQLLHPHAAGYSFELPDGSGSVHTAAIASGSRAGEVKVTVAPFDRDLGGGGQRRTFTVEPEAAVRAAARCRTFRPELYCIVAQKPFLLQPHEAGAPAPHPFCRALNLWLRVHGQRLRRVVRSPQTAAAERDHPSIRRVLSPNNLPHRRRRVLLPALPAGDRHPGNAYHAARARSAAQRASALATAVLGGRTHVVLGSVSVSVLGSVTEEDPRPRALVALVQGPPLPARRGVAMVDAAAFAAACIRSPQASPHARLCHGAVSCLAQLAHVEPPPSFLDSNVEDSARGGDLVPPGEGVHLPPPALAVPWRRCIFAGKRTMRDLGACRVVCTMDEKMRRIEAVVEVQPSAAGSPMRCHILHISTQRVAEALESPRILQRRFRTALGRALATALVVTPGGAGDDSGVDKDLLLDADALNEAVGREMADSKGAGAGVPHALRHALNVDAPAPRCPPSRTGCRHRAAASVVGMGVDGKRGVGAAAASRPARAERPVEPCGLGKRSSAAERIQRAVRELQKARQSDRPPLLAAGRGRLLARRASFIPEYGYCILQALTPAVEPPVHTLLVTCALVAEDGTRNSRAPQLLWRLWPLSSVAPRAIGRPPSEARKLVKCLLGRVDVCLPRLAPRLLLRGPDDSRVTRRAMLLGVEDARVALHFGNANGAVGVTAARDRPPMLKAAGSASLAEVLPARLRAAVEEGRAQPVSARYIVSRMAVVRDPETRRWRIRLNCDREECEAARRSLRLHHRRVTTEGRHEAATIVQASYRGHLVRQGLREVNQAAATVQSLFRGARTRQQQRRRLSAASNIQRSFRRHFARKERLRQRAAGRVLLRTMRRAATALARRRMSLASMLLTRWAHSRIEHRRVMALFPRLADRTAFVRGVGPCRVRAFLDRSVDGIVFSCRKPRQERAVDGSPPEGSAPSQKPSLVWDCGIVVCRVAMGPLRRAIPDLQVGSVLEKYIAAYLSRNLAVDGGADGTTGSIVVRDDAMRMLRSHALRANAGSEGVEAGSHSVLDRIVAQGHMDEAKARARRQAAHLEAFSRERRRKRHLRQVERVYTTTIRPADSLAAPEGGGGRSAALDGRCRAGSGSGAHSVCHGGRASRAHSRDGAGPSRGGHTTDRRRPRSVASPRVGEESGYSHTLAAVKASPLREAAKSAPIANQGSTRDGWLQLDPERVHRLEKRSYEDMLRQRRLRRQAKTGAPAGGALWPDAARVEDRRKRGHSLSAPSWGNGSESSGGALLPRLESAANARQPHKKGPSSGMRRRLPATATLKELEAAVSLPHRVPTKELIMLVSCLAQLPFHASMPRTPFPHPLALLPPLPRSEVSNAQRGRQELA